MLDTLRQIARDRILGLVALSVFCYGAYAASIAPHQSLVAISVFGFTDGAYSAIMAFGSALSVTASVWIGILTDQKGDRRKILIASAALGAAGAGLVFLVRSPTAYLVAHMLVLPFSATIFGQLFALARLATAEQTAASRDGTMAALRALFALPFVIVLPLWSLAFDRGAPLILIYGVLALGFAVITALLAIRWPSARAAGLNDPKSGIRFYAALREMTAWPVTARILVIASVQAGVTLYMVLLGLIMTTGGGRETSDVSLFAGLVAGLEVPFMLASPMLLSRLSKSALIAAAAFIHAGFLCAFPLAAPYPVVWFLAIPAAMGAAVTLSVPIAYMQDLMSARPGAGGALIAVLHVTGQVIAAAVFGLGTAISGYGLAAMLGAGLAAASGLTLLMMDRRRPA